MEEKLTMMTGSKTSILNMANWVFQQKNAYSTINTVLEYFKKNRFNMDCFFLIHEVALLSKAPGGNQKLKARTNRLVGAFTFEMINLKFSNKPTEKEKNAIRRCVDIWRRHNIFAPHIIDRLNFIHNSYNVQCSLMSNTETA